MAYEIYDKRRRFCQSRLSLKGAQEWAQDTWGRSLIFGEFINGWSMVYKVGVRGVKKGIQTHVGYIKEKEL